jgi:protein-tyrosine phosphatase
MGNDHSLPPSNYKFSDTCNVVWTYPDGTPFIYLGNKWSSKFPIEELKTRRITHIVNATKNERHVHWRSIKYCKIAIRDDVGVDISPYLKKTYKFIKRAYDRKEAVLVHCYAGISRSSTVVLDFLMKEFEMSLRDALKHVSDRRTIIQPNMGFFLTLTNIEKELRGVQEPSITYNEFAMQGF